MPLLRRRDNLASEADLGNSTSVTTKFGPNAEFDARHHAEPGEASSTLSELPTTQSSAPPSRQGGHHPTLRPDSPPIQEQSQKHKRFSTLRFRNASDPQLSARHKQQAEKTPPMPTPRMYSSSPH